MQLASKSCTCLCTLYNDRGNAEEREKESVLRHFLSLLPLNKHGGRMNYYGHAELSQLLEKHNTIIIPLENVHNILIKIVFTKDITMNLE